MSRAAGKIVVVTGAAGGQGAAETRTCGCHAEREIDGTDVEDAIAL